MASYHVSSSAEFDLDEITAYTIRRWSIGQAGRYLEQIREAFNRLAENPFLGRHVADFNQNLRRVEQGSHVIFSRTSNDGILVVRVQHRSMLPTSHTFDPTEPNA